MNIDNIIERIEKELTYETKGKEKINKRDKEILRCCSYEDYVDKY